VRTPTPQPELDEIEDKVRHALHARAEAYIITAPSAAKAAPRRTRPWDKHPAIVGLAVAAVLIATVVVAAAWLWHNSSASEERPAGPIITEVPTTLPGSDSGATSPFTVSECIKRRSLQLDSHGMLAVSDATLGNIEFPVTQFCTEETALEPPDPNGGIIASIHSSGGHLQALYYEYTDIVDQNGGVRRTPSKTPLPPDVVAERFAAMRAAQEHTAPRDTGR
jgi:hypothetical protein